jgi:hypothetical protein
MYFEKFEKVVPAVIGMQSLIGTSNQYPLSWGNYFWLHNGPRVLNFWAENLQAANNKFLTDGMVQIVEWIWDEGRTCIIKDERIPQDWYYQKLCFTGGGHVPVDIATDIYELIGDPSFELEQFTDPVSYWAKRGGQYFPNGCVRFNLR